jgi:hypothetical protein
MNYDPAAARVTWLFQRRRVSGTAPKHGMALTGGYAVFVLDPLPYYRVEFDTDLPGEGVVYYEPFSEREGSTNSSDSSLPVPYTYPIRAIEIVDSQPNIDLFAMNVNLGL